MYYTRYPVTTLFFHIPKKKNIYIYSYSCATKEKLYKLHFRLRGVVVLELDEETQKNDAFTLLNVRVLECIRSTECILVFIRVSQRAAIGWRVTECSCGGPWSGIKSYARRQVLSSSFNTTPLSLLSLWVWLEGGRWRILEEKEHIF